MELIDGGDEGTSCQVGNRSGTEGKREISRVVYLSSASVLPCSLLTCIFWSDLRTLTMSVTVVLSWIEVDQV